MFDRKSKSKSIAAQNAGRFGTACSMRVALGGALILGRHSDDLAAIMATLGRRFSDFVIAMTAKRIAHIGIAR